MKNHIHRTEFPAPHSRGTRRIARRFSLGVFSALLAPALLTLLAPRASAQVLYTEGFDSSEAGSKWHGYNSWLSNGIAQNADIVSKNNNLVGHVDSGYDTGFKRPYYLIYNFEAPYALQTAAYRFSFDVAGDITRGFNVALGSNTIIGGPGGLIPEASEKEIASMRMVGLRLGNAESGTNYRIAGFTQASDGTKDFSYVYNSPTPGVAPVNFNSTTLYKTYLDINLTGQTVDIDGSPLESGKIRLTYNIFGTGGMETYAITFAPPEDFTQLSSIIIQKDVATTAQYYIDNLQLEAYAIPESPTVAYAALAGVVLLTLKIKPLIRGLHARESHSPGRLPL